MKILVANDDGIHAKGLHELVKELSKHFEVVVAAPNEQKSAASSGFTYTKPIRAEKVILDETPSIPAYSIHGTPADCVRLGLSTLFQDVDMVVTGINHGSNTGTDILYSGTIGSAMEACIMGIPAIAMSNYAAKPQDFSGCATIATMAVNYLMNHPVQQGTILSVNSPDGPFENIKGIRKGYVSTLKYNQRYEKVTSPYGHDFYYRHVTEYENISSTPDADDALVNDGYAVVTPLHYDMTNYECLKSIDTDIWNNFE
mgnify:CR=1 FL=1